MSIYSNIYIKRNEKASVLINGVGGSDYAYVEIEVKDFFQIHHIYKFLVDKNDAYVIGKLFYSKTEGRGDKAIDNFYDHKIKSYEYFDDPKFTKKMIKEIQSNWYKGRPKESLIKLKKRVLNDLKLIDKELNKKVDDKK